MWVKRTKDAYRVIECVAGAFCFCFYPIFYYFLVYKDSQTSYAIIDDVTSVFNLIIALMFMGSSI